MPRRPRQGMGGLVYHVLNRSAKRETLFRKELDYLAFEKTLTEVCALCPLRILDFEVMPNHWHMLVWPEQDGDLSRFMHRLTMTHTQRHHAAHRNVGTGPLYQGRFKSFPVQEDAHFLTVARYIQRNALRAGLVKRAEDWRWGGLWCRFSGRSEVRAILSAWPVPEPRNLLDWVNRPMLDTELTALRTSVTRGHPFGDPIWQDVTARRLGLPAVLLGRGRPKTAQGPS
jgi:putative transposase